jgi:hypothetical protein
MVKLRWLLCCLALAACQREANSADAADVAVEDPCRPSDEIERGLLTTGSAARAGGLTVANGVRTLGESVGGFFEGGSARAKEEWDAGAERTRTTAREEGAVTKQTAHTSRCR